MHERPQQTAAPAGAVTGGAAGASAATGHRDDSQGDNNRRDDNRRDLRLDVFRGIALWFIFLDHIPDNPFAWLTLRNYGFSDTTEIFFFVSGYTCALAYGRALRDHGWSAALARTLRRGLEIYGAFLLLALVLFAAVHAAGGGRDLTDATNTTIFFTAPGETLRHLLRLQYMPVNTDVLPTFALFHAMFAPLLWLLLRAPNAALIAALALYALVQVFGWAIPTWPRGEWFFNPLAWQVLFVFGAWIVMGGRALIAPLLNSRALLVAALVYLAFSLVVALGWQIAVLKPMVPEAINRLIYPIDKSSLDPLRLLHFLALALAAVRLLPLGWRGLSSPAIVAAIRCGENSLAIYSIGVILSFAAGAALAKLGATLALQAALSLAGILVMAAAATLMTRLTKLGAHEPKLF